MGGPNRYRVRDDGGQLANEKILGDIIINSRNNGQPFEGNRLRIRFNVGGGFGDEIEILTNCNEIKIGQEYDDGNLTVIGAVSSTSGIICCAPEDSDQTPPEIINCPTNANLIVNTGCEAFYSWAEPTVSDNCGFAEFTEQPDSNSGNFPLGDTIIKYVATDDSGNESICEFTITVEEESELMILNCPSDIEVPTDNNCKSTVSWVEPSVVNNCNLASFESNFEPGDEFPIGTTDVIYIAVDNDGNEIICQFTITVFEESEIVISDCPNDIEVPTDNNCKSTVSWVEPSVANNCSLISFDSNFEPGDEFPIGKTIVKYTALDTNGNEKLCQFTITVFEESEIVISDCPTDIEVITDNSCITKVDWQEPIISDNCNVVSFESNFKPGDSFPTGATEVIYTAMDPFGITLTCSFEVIVINSFEPTVSNCPSDINLEAFEVETIEVEWQEPILEWQCNATNLMSNYISGDKFGIGETEVTYSYIYEVDTIIACSFLVTVKFIEVEFDIPKLLTLNSDGINDEWKLGGIEDFEDNKVVIVDRWGGEVYKASGYNNTDRIWKGENKKGELVPTGTYYYIIQAISNSRVIKKSGFVELVR